MKNYLKKTWKNKVAAIVLMVAGYLMLKVDGDGTVLVLATTMAMPLFFIKQNVVMIGRREDDEK